MNAEYYSHRYADIILNADYVLRKEIDDVIRCIDYNLVVKRFEDDNIKKISQGSKTSKGKQAIINTLFREELQKRLWNIEKSIFDDPNNDLIMDFIKREVGLDVAFNHRSFIGGDLLRFQAAAEVKNIIKVGIYICPKKAFAKVVSPLDGSSMVNFERTQWYLKTLYPVITVPILLIGLNK